MRFVKWKNKKNGKKTKKKGKKMAKKGFAIIGKGVTLSAGMGHNILRYDLGFIAIYCIFALKNQ